MVHNKGLAFFSDDVAFLQRATLYLQHYPSHLALGWTPIGRVGRSTRKWRTKREKRERFAWVAARLEALGYEVPKRLRRDTEGK